MLIENFIIGGRPFSTLVVEIFTFRWLYVHLYGDLGLTFWWLNVLINGDLVSYLYVGHLQIGFQGAVFLPFRTTFYTTFLTNVIPVNALQSATCSKYGG